MTMEPNLFRAAVAEVPFVDIVTTMFDNTIPLTANEWEEVFFFYFFLQFFLFLLFSC